MRCSGRELRHSSHASSSVPVREGSARAHKTASLAHTRGSLARLARDRHADRRGSGVGARDAGREGRPEDQALPARDVALAADDGRSANAEPESASEVARRSVPATRSPAVASARGPREAAGAQPASCGRLAVPTASRGFVERRARPVLGRPPDGSSVHAHVCPAPPASARVGQPLEAARADVGRRARPSLGAGLLPLAQHGKDLRSHLITRRSP